MANDEDDDMENLMEQMESIHMKVKFSCEDCDAGFDEEGYLQQHRKKKHDDVLKPFQCLECDNTLSSKRNLETHVKKIHRTCKVCKKMFETSDLVSQHKIEHNLVKH